MMVAELLLNREGEHRSSQRRGNSGRVGDGGEARIQRKKGNGCCNWWCAVVEVE